MIDHEDTANPLQAKGPSARIISARSHKRRSKAARRHWKEMAAAKRKGSLAALAAGRSKKLALYASQRQAWEIIKGRLDGEGTKALAKKYGGMKRVLYVLRSADIPKSKQCKYDRSIPFTRGSGTALQKSLGFTKEEFAKHAQVSERRVVIWLTGPQKKLDPSEARKCIALRGQVAAKLLADETVEKLSNLDSYSRAEVLVTLFPRLKTEYKLLLATSPAIRAFAKTSKAVPAEKELGNFVYDEAVKKTNGFRVFLRWLRDVAPWMLANWKRYQGDEDARFLAYELLASTCTCPWKIVKAALSNRTARLADRRMREIIRLHGPFAGIPTARAAAVPRAKGGAPKKTKPDFMVFGEIVKPRLGRFSTGFAAMVRAKKEGSLTQSWETQLANSSFSREEIAAIGLSRNSVTAAIRWASDHQGISFKTGKNYFSLYQANPEQA